MNILNDFVDEGPTRDTRLSKKTLQNIRKSRISKKKVLKKYGGKIPQSIIKADFRNSQIDEIFEKRNLSNNLHQVKYKGPSDMGSIGSISKFPWNVGEIFLKMYTKSNDWVFDPFAGHNSRLSIVYTNRRNYQGYDICHEYIKFNKKVKRILYSQETLDKSSIKINLFETDSRNIQIEKESMDFCITSPPYWRQEKYGNEKGQLYNCKTYTKFLKELKKVAIICYNALKEGSKCVWLVNDFRYKKTKTFYLFHVDIIKIFQEIGFYIRDIAIIDLGSALRASFPNQFNKELMIPKRHEYAIIGEKIDKKNY